MNQTRDLMNILKFNTHRAIKMLQLLNNNKIFSTEIFTTKSINTNCLFLANGCYYTCTFYLSQNNNEYIIYLDVINTTTKNKKIIDIPLHFTAIKDMKISFCSAFLLLYYKI